MLSWLLLNSILPLSPVGLAWGGGRLIPNKRRAVFEIVRDGQLFFYCTGIIAVTLNDIITKTISAEPELTIFLSILLVVFAGLFGLVAVNREETNPKITGWTSLVSVVLATTVVVYIRRNGGAL